MLIVPTEMCRLHGEEACLNKEESHPAQNFNSLRFVLSTFSVVECSKINDCRQLIKQTKSHSVDDQHHTLAMETNIIVLLIPGYTIVLVC